MTPSNNAKSLSTGSAGSMRLSAYLADFAENSFDAVVAFNSLWQVVYWNPAAERMYGWEASEALGKTVADLFWPVATLQDREDARQMLSRLVGRETVRGERKMHRKEGPPFWVEYTVRAVLEEDSAFSRYLGVYRDINEHKLIEQALQENEERFRSMANAAPVMIWISGVDKLYTWFNQSWLNFVGRPLEQELGNGWAENIHPDDSERCLQTYSTAFDARQSFSMEYRLKRRDGEYRWLLDNGVPSYGTSNEFIGYIGSCIDITEHKQREEALRDSEERFYKAFHASPNAIVISHVEDGRIETVNNTFVRFFGYSNEEVAGKTSTELGMFVNPADRQKAVRRLQTDKAVRDFEIDVRLKSGEIRNISLSVELVSISEESMMLTTIQDITYRKQVEETLRSSEEKYRTLFEAIDEGFCIIEVLFDSDKPIDYRFLETNPAFEEHTGLSNARGQLVREIIPEHDEHWFQNYGRVAMTGEPARFENVALALGRFYDVYAFRVGEPEQRRVAVLFNDITTRKQAEETLRKSKERYATLFNTISEGFAHYRAIYNDAGKLVDLLVMDINPAGALMSGVDREKQIGKTWKQVWPGVEDSLFAVYEQVDQTGQLARFNHFSPITGRIYQSSISRIIPGELVATFFDITEIKEAEKTLARQRELLQRVFENIPVLLVMWESALQRFTLNRHAEIVLGWTTADANNGDFMSKAYPDPAYRAEVSAYMQSLAGGFREWFTTARNGERIPIDWANIRLADETMIGIGVDLRDRKQAEESLRARTEELETLLQVSPVAFFVAYDPECTRITANPAGYQLVELPQDSNQNVSKSAPAEERPAYRVFRDGVEVASQDLPMQVAARLGTEVVEESLELRFENGSHKHIYAYARPLIGENGKPRGAIAAMLDITKRKRAEEKLRESEQRFRSLANTVPSMVWTAAPDGTILYSNEFWQKYAGLNPEEAGSNWAELLIHPDDYERFVTAWTRAIETVTDEYFFEARIRRYDGQYRWFQARALPIRDDQGNVVAWYGVSMDIHDRIEAVHALRESQQKLQFLNETLEQKVNEQTAEVRKLSYDLTKAELRERHRIAHILHEDLQQRLYAVKMQLASRLNKLKNLNPAIELEFAETNKQLDQILALTRNLTVELSPPILRDEGLAQALDWLGSQMYKNHGLQIDIQAEESFAIPDEGTRALLFACVRELLFNIVKHAEVDRAVVALQRSRDDLRIEVWDKGKGFNLDVLSGSNTSNMDKDEHKQWSFGLPTLRHQLSLLGGQMDIQSEPDDGTRITITVPYSS